VLSIGKIAAGQHRYYEQQVAQGVDDYYSGRGEAQGEWVGTGAGELGLAGAVSGGQFNALIAGLDPGDPAKRLRAGARDPKIAALDLTFSAPKSISVLFAIATADVSAGLVAAHEEAVRAALGYLEETAVMVRRGHAGEHQELGAGLIAAAYRHRMSRSLDPQLHTHVVAANLTRGPDGRFTALHAAPLYRAAKTAGYLYQAHLRSAVRDRLGLEWGPVHKGAAELNDLSAEVLRVFSQRRAQVEQAVALREAEVGRSLTRAERSAWGAIATRERKHYGVDTHSWREEVLARAAEHGLDGELVERIVAGGRDRIERRELAGDGALEQAGGPVSETELGDVLVGPLGLTERANTFDGLVVLRAFAAAARQGATVATVRGQSGRFVGRRDVLETDRSTLTSADLVACEHALISGAISRANSGVAQLAEPTVAATVGASGRSLTVDQAAAVRGVATSGNGIDVIEALAGTGKTYTAGVLREVYEQAGYTVLGVAPSGRAARELSEQAGVPSRTLDSRLLTIDHRHPLPDRCVVIFDEAAMAPTRESERLLRHAGSVDAKVVAIGDPGQLPSVRAGGWMAALGERLGAARLTEVLRQRDHTERLALAALHDGRPQRWLDWATSAGRAEVLADDPAALKRAVAEWATAAEEHGVDQSVLIALDRSTRHALNELARDRRRDAGLLGDEQNYGPVTVAVGDRVICRRNDRDLDVDNGTRGTVRHLDTDGITFETDAHLTRRLPAGYVADHVEHAYALTGHGMQGATVEHATVLASPHDLTRGWSYTALSRARGHTQLLIRDTTLEPASREEFAPAPRSQPPDPRGVLERVARRMLERDDEDLALDQLPAPGRADDPHLAYGHESGPAQEQAAERAEPRIPNPVGPLLRELRDQLDRLNAQLRALPTQELAQIDDLDARARTLTAQRDLLHSDVERLPPPRNRRLGRSDDPHLVDRTRLTSALTGTQRELDRTLAQRAAFARQLGDTDAIREERDALTNATTALRCTLLERRNELAERELATRPAWAREALGERPDHGWQAERWDHAARTIARYRIHHDITDTHNPLGPPPTDPHQRADYQRARQALQQLGRDAPSHELDLT